MNSLADLKYLRLRTFQSLLGPFSARQRSKRMRMFESWAGLNPGDRVLDLGGHPEIWNWVEKPLSITLLNLPGSIPDISGASIHKFTTVEGDACEVSALAPGSFKLVFSNSVIEHVGAEDRQAAFAREVRRFGCSYWVQTPAPWFPIECHTGMPFWWFYPEALRDFFIRGWRRKLPAWTDLIAGTRVLSRRRMQHLFPEATIDAERFVGMTKSYVARYRAPVGPGRG